jgi:acetylornithine deacetylase/succinyl-diaminopimelate desuccinylase-like protein
VNRALLDELFEFLRIPSVSSGGGEPAELRRAAEWICAKVEHAGGTAEVVDTAGNPLAVGRLQAAARKDAPTVMIYGHYDVQSPDPVSEWESDPFVPEVRDGRIYGRGAADDKGNFFPLLYVACELASAGELPVNVRVLAEGEEEIGSPNISPFVESDEEGADCIVVFDSSMVDENTPAITIAVRGLVAFAVTVRTGKRDLHSGLYGGAALNAVHVLHTLLGQILPNSEGILRRELREGLIDPDEAELQSWASLPPGPQVLADVGAHPISESAALDYYRRNWADASLDVNGISGGDATQQRTIIPVEAHAKITVRLAPEQDPEAIATAVEGLIVDAAPSTADVTVRFSGKARPASFDPSSKAMVLAAQALERACGRAPVLIRSGGSIPVLAAFAEKEIPTILSGFALAEDAFHAPNESYRLESLELGERAARELYSALARL